MSGVSVSRSRVASPTFLSEEATRFVPERGCNSSSSKGAELVYERLLCRSLCSRRLRVHSHLMTIAPQDLNHLTHQRLRHPLFATTTAAVHLRRTLHASAAEDSNNNTRTLTLLPFCCCCCSHCLASETNRRSTSAADVWTDGDSRRRESPVDVFA